MISLSVFPAIGKNGTVLPRLPLGTHTVTVEARSACNQSEKVQTRFEIQVPHGVRIKDTQGQCSAGELGCSV